MTYDCMTEEELALWREAADKARRLLGYGVKGPCTDCPLWFAEQARASGCCNGTPRLINRRGTRGPMPTYATPQERTAARRQTWREAKRRERQKAATI